MTVRYRADNHHFSYVSILQAKYLDLSGSDAYIIGAYQPNESQTPTLLSVLSPLQFWVSLIDLYDSISADVNSFQFVCQTQITVQASYC